MDHAFIRSSGQRIHRELATVVESDMGGWPLLAPALHLVPGAIDLLEAGGAFLQLGCGEGQALNILAGGFTNSRFIGTDNDLEALDHAAAEAMLLGLANVTFRPLDTALPAERASCDLVHLTPALQTRPDLAPLLRAAARALRARGHLLLQLPGTGVRSVAPDDRLVSVFRTVARSDRTSGGLPPTAQPLHGLRQLVQSAGLTNIRVERARDARWVIARTP
jgi:SAM-dependent methyltransferase